MWGRGLSLCSGLISQANWTLRVQFACDINPFFLLEGLQELGYGWAQDYHHDAGEDEEDHGQEHLDGGDPCLLLGSLAPARAHVLGLGPEQGPYARAHLLVLHHG